MKTPFFCFLAAFLILAATTSRACEYCRMAAEDPEAARLALAAHASTGAFPLQTTINQFKGDTPAAVLTAPPVAGAVATSAADLPTRLLPPAAHRTLAPVKAPTVPVAVPAVVAAHPSTHSASWADAGLLGIFGFLGVFGWRTRRTPGSDR